MSRQRVELLARLIETEVALRDSSGDTTPTESKLLQRVRREAREAQTSAPPRPRLTRLPITPNSSTGQRKRGQAAVLIEAAKAALARAHRPLHIAELRASIEKAGIPIPGQGEDANLIVHVRKSDEIVRIGRGFYALAEWNLPVPRVPSQPRRKAS
jgi:hypothetical protein